jgi:hypothetical protein
LISDLQIHFAEEKGHQIYDALKSGMSSEEDFEITRDDR